MYILIVHLIVERVGARRNQENSKGKLYQTKMVYQITPVSSSASSERIPIIKKRNKNSELTSDYIIWHKVFIILLH